MGLRLQQMGGEMSYGYEISCKRCKGATQLDDGVVLTPDNEWLCLKCAAPVIEAHARSIVGPFFAPWQAFVRFVRKVFS